MLYKTDNLHGGDIYGNGMVQDHSVNLNPLGCPDKVRQAMKDALEHTSEYPDPHCRELVRAIAAYEHIPQSFILCGNGAAELIYSYCNALVMIRKGDLSQWQLHAAETAPAFSEYSLAVENAGGQMSRYYLDSKKNFRLGEAFLDFIRSEKPDAVFLCNPNNPDGRTIEHRLSERILKLCREMGIRLFVDECFLELSENGCSLKEYLEEYQGLFILKSFTKNFAIPGVRLGYCMSADKDLLMAMSRTVQPWNISVIAQAAGIAAAGEYSFVMQARRYISMEREWLIRELAETGLKVCPSEANYILFHIKEAPLSDSADSQTSTLGQRLLKRGIAIRNCDNYHGLGRGWYRIGIRKHEDNLLLVKAIREEIQNTGQGTRR